MAYERVVDWFLNANHEHIAAYTVQTRGHIGRRPENDPVLLVALKYEVEAFLRSLPREHQTAELRGKLIHAFLKQLPEGSQSRH